MWAPAARMQVHPYAPVTFLGLAKICLLPVAKMIVGEGLLWKKTSLKLCR